MHHFFAMYMCGFVPWIIVRENGIPVPKVVPIGSFTWSVEVEDSVDEYSYKPSMGDVSRHRKDTQRALNKKQGISGQKRARRITIPF